MVWGGPQAHEGYRANAIFITWGDAYYIAHGCFLVVSVIVGNNRGVTAVKFHLNMNHVWLIKRLILLVGALSVFSILTSSRTQAMNTNIWRVQGDNTDGIDHSSWQVILDTYIEYKQDISNYPPVNLFCYRNVSKQDRLNLTAYLDYLQSIDPRNYPKTEQFAYWVNLYNALTVDLILKNYPIKSITKLGSLFSFGPWDETIAKVAGHALTLNDIEHHILRPIWQDPRIHYAVNCASFSCPNLSDKAYTAANAEALLEQGAHDYVNHPRGLNLRGNKLELSKIYKWYSDDFGDSEKEVIDHIIRYVNPVLRNRLKSFNGKINYRYDWRLNESKQP